MIKILGMESVNLFTDLPTGFIYCLSIGIFGR